MAKVGLAMVRVVGPALILVAASLLGLPGIPMAASVEDVFAAAVFLHRTMSQTASIDGVEYEVGVRKRGDTGFAPRTVTRFGSGLFVTDRRLLFLVTAEHLARQMDADAQVTIRAEGDIPRTFRLGTLAGAVGPITWTFHDTADIAVLRLTPPADAMPTLAGHFLPLEMLRDKLEPPDREKPLTTVGFPLGLGVKDRFSPISKEAKPASGLLVLPRFDTKRPALFFLLDSPSVGGFSGAPLFEFPGAYSSKGGLTIGGRLAVVGIIHGTISDDTGGKFGAVVPAALVLETLAKAGATRATP
jgi:hypothetical protein